MYACIITIIHSKVSNNKYYYCMYCRIGVKKQYHIIAKDKNKPGETANEYNDVAQNVPTLTENDIKKY